MWDNQQTKTPDLNAMKVRIALLEDEKEEEKTMVAMIERFFQETGHGYEIATFSDSHEFLKLNFELYDLVLLDIILSEKNNGIDVAKEIRKTNKNIAIMFITKTAQFAIDGYNVDALDYILKPLSYYAFALKLKKALHYLENTEQGYRPQNDRWHRALEGGRHHLLRGHPSLSLRPFQGQGL